jgi:hypothetical protein
MKRYSHHLAVLAAAAVILIANLTACGARSGDDEATVTFTWELGTTGETCTTRATEVMVRFYEEGAPMDEWLVHEMRPCEEGGMEITDLAPGRYYLRLEALCSGGSIAYQYPLYEDQVVRLDPGVNDLGSIVLDKISTSCDL